MQDKDKDIYKAVQLVFPDPVKFGSFCINNGEIERIFGHSDVANTPVAIYSVTGAFRKGKSFLLNLFLKYLWADNDQKEKYWFEKEEDNLSKGFFWQGGRNKVTEGIWIWDEPFFKETSEGKVAIFLMDTQGSFDSSSSMTGTSVIFALSTLISSMQIYNVMDQIQEDSLQNLQLFVEYGKIIKGESKSLESQFQDLLFLVRDWSDTDVPLGFEGGQIHLNEVLQPKVDHHDLSSVRETIHLVFEKVSCCLLPSPGEKVIERGRSDGNNLKLGDVKPKFLQTVNSIATNIFAGENIVTKQIFNQAVTGIDLINAALEYFEVIQSGKMPNVGTIMQECKEYMGDTELTDTHNKHKEEVIKKYNEQPKFGDQKFVNTYQKHLEELMDQTFCLIYKLRNDRYMDQIKVQILYVSDEAKEMYRNKMENSTTNESYVENNLLAEINLQISKSVIEWFKQNTAQFPQDIRLSYQNNIVHWTENEFQKIDRKNTNKQRAFSRLQRRRVKAHGKYMEIIEANTLKYTENLDEIHEDAKMEAIKAFGDEDNTEASNDFMRVKKQLNKDLKDHYRTVVNKNEENKNRLIDAASMCLNKLKEDYGSFMYNLCDGKYIKLSLLEDEHKKHKENAKSKIHQLMEDCPQIRDEFLKKCDEELENLFHRIKKMNELMKLITLRRIVNKAALVASCVSAGATAGVLAGPIGVGVGAAVGATIGALVVAKDFKRDISPFL